MSDASGGMLHDASHHALSDGARVAHGDSSRHESMTSTSCPPNIAERGARRRSRGGIAWLIIGAAAAIVLIARGAAPATLLFLAIPFSLGALGVGQARARTCVFLAALGTRETELADQPRFGEAELGAIRRRAMWLSARALASGVALALLLAGVAWMARR